jgi:gluconate kinase
MPKGLLKSQFDTLEVPTEALTISIDQTPNEIVIEITKKL